MLKCVFPATVHSFFVTHIKHDILIFSSLVKERERQRQLARERLAERQHRIKEGKGEVTQDVNQLAAEEEELLEVIGADGMLLSSFLFLSFFFLTCFISGLP